VSGCSLELDAALKEARVFFAARAFLKRQLWAGD
jgi:hypothetical protein